MHDMKAPRLAEAYCDRLYDRRARGLTRAPSAGLSPRSLAPAWSARDMQPGQDIYLALVEVTPCLSPKTVCHHLTRQLLLAWDCARSLYE